MNVLLVDDHPLFLEGICNLLAARDIPIVGIAHDGLQALHQARELQPDVILMDIQMPTCNGLEATRLIKAEMPDIHIVMLTMSDDDETVFEAIRSGATGYLNKTLSSDQFFNLLFGLAKGEAPLTPGIAARVLNEFAQQEQRTNHGRTTTPPAHDSEPEAESETLTERQREVLTLVAQGYTYKEIGSILHLAERTIKYHMQGIVQRLHLKNRVEIIAYARRVGLDTMPPTESRARGES
jgi:two-component system NarL family response regulator